MNGLLALTLFGSTILFWLSAIIFLIMCFVAESNKNGFIATGTLIVVAILYHFWGDIKPILGFLTILNISIYLAIGLVYSSIRTFFEGRKLGKKLKDLPTKEEANSKSRKNTGNEYYGDTKESVKKEFVEKLKRNVFRWWFNWIISLISWAITDLLKDIWDFVYSKLKNFYNYILELGIKSVS